MLRTYLLTAFLAVAEASILAPEESEAIGDIVAETMAAQMLTDGAV